MAKYKMKDLGPAIYYLGIDMPRRCTSGHCKEEGIGPTVACLGILYKKRGRLDDAEKMYQRALQGYEKAVGLENVARYQPALMTISNLGNLFAAQGHLATKEMFIH
ncbi:hypothetical protein V8E54_003842 [Elaphomyces granulatus]